MADGGCEEILGNAALLAANDLELPAGFDLARVERRSRPGGPARATPAAQPPV